MLSASPRAYPVRSPRRGAVLGRTQNLNYPAFEDPERAVAARVSRGLPKPAELPKLDWRKPVPVPRLSPRGGKVPPLLQKSVGDRWGDALNQHFGKRVTGQKIFEKIDRDRSGGLAPEEALKSILALHIQCDPEELGSLMRECDTNGDGVIDVHEFQAALGKLSNRFGGADWHRGINKTKTSMVLQHDLGADTGGAATEQELDKYVRAMRDMVETKYGLLRKAFMSFDRDRNNYLSKDEIVQCIRNFSLAVPINHIGQIFDEILDKDGNGKVSYIEFCDKIKQVELEKQI